MNHRVPGLLMLLLVACGDSKTGSVDARVGDAANADGRTNSDREDGAHVDDLPRPDVREESRADTNETKNDSGASDAAIDTCADADGRAVDGTEVDAGLDAPNGDAAIDAGIAIDAGVASEVGSALDVAGVCKSSRWYCLDEAGIQIPGCGDSCGGIAAFKCPSSELVCVTSRPSMWNDSAVNYCIPRRAAACTTAADCACLPGDCSQWGGVTSSFRWNCSNGICGVSCMP